MHIKKTISLLLLFCFLTIFSQAQIYNAALIDTSKKELYYGIDNLLKVADNNENSLVFVINKQDTFTTTKGTIRYSPSTSNSSVIEVYLQDKIIAKETFTHKFINKAELKIGPKIKETYTLNDVINCPTLEYTDSSNNIINLTYAIVNFEMTLIQKDRTIIIVDSLNLGTDTVEITDPISGEITIEIQQRTETEYNKTHYGNTISPKHIALLKQTQKGDKLIISNIKINCPDNQIRRSDDVILIKE